MPVEVELKLQDLAKIALGAPELTNVSISILHSLIDILLKKLNCQNETVALSSFEAKYLEKILESSKTSPLAFNDEHVEIVAAKLERLQKLEHDINKLDTKLEHHLEETRRENKLLPATLNWENWESYGLEDLCSICDPNSDIACKLLKNTDFLKKLLRRISAPMVERMFYFEDKLKALHEEFVHFTKRAEEEYLKVRLLETCISEIELLRKKVDENQIEFSCSMEEVQDMLDSKLDKLHMPDLKKYIQDNFQRIDKEIQKFEYKQQCPKAAGIIMDGVRCMSCGVANVCSEVGAQPTAILPDVKVKETRKLAKYCGSSQKDVNSSTKPQNLGNVSKMPSTKKSAHRAGNQCRTSGDDFELLEGFDGSLYRKG